MEHLKDVGLLVCTPVEDPINPEILCADAIVEVFPLWTLGICRRLDWIRTNVTERARHTDAIRTNEVFVVVILRIAVVPLWIPVLRGFGVKVWVREETQPDDAARVTIVRTDRHGLRQVLIWPARRQWLARRTPAPPG